MPSAPEPAKRSSTRAPWTASPRTLKSASRTRSLVGAGLAAGGRDEPAPAEVPATTLMGRWIGRMLSAGERILGRGGACGRSAGRASVDARTHELAAAPPPARSRPGASPPPATARCRTCDALARHDHDDARSDTPLTPATAPARPPRTPAPARRRAARARARPARDPPPAASRAYTFAASASASSSGSCAKRTAPDPTAACPRSRPRRAARDRSAASSKPSECALQRPQPRGVLGPEQQAHRRVRAAPDAPAQLVQLADPVALGALDEHHRRVGDVDADLDDRRRDEHVGAAGREARASPPACPASASGRAAARRGSRAARRRAGARTPPSPRAPAAPRTPPPAGTRRTPGAPRRAPRG